MDTTGFYDVLAEGYHLIFLDWAASRASANPSWQPGAQRLEHTLSPRNPLPCLTRSATRTPS